MSHDGFGLRLGSKIARSEGWLVSNASVLSIRSPSGEKQYVSAALLKGKTSFATMVSSLPGWEVRCVSDNVNWTHVGSDGRLYAINPENGFSGPVIGTSFAKSRSTLDTLQKNVIFTNVALTSDGEVWWEGLTLKNTREISRLDRSTLDT